ncbi:MAG: FG-GAP-like repeat-containing protein [Candidatus Cloacimonetes bacterium]|nr:FG-GAP-like repeat-containing protein [Candidatus Cloacimonadota bacterium]
MNAGDINADGFDDLLIVERFAIADEDSVALRFFYGGPNADLEPDFEIIIQASQDRYKIKPLSCIGDVNNDGYDDLGCSVWANDAFNHEFKLAILYGGTWNLEILDDTVIGHQYRHDIEPVGDVNGDGIDDFVTGFAATINGEYNFYRYLYLGSNTFNINDRILLYQVPCANSGGQMFAAAYGIGDFNGDGYDDMVYCNGASWYDNNKIRLGGPNILVTEEITVQSYQLANLMELISPQKVAYGDFNGDGFSDLAASNWRAFTWIGHAGIWLGKAIPNGQYDLRISSPPSSPFHQFGWQLAAGDFNGDGFCDLAVSAPQSDSPNPWYLGYVYIFAGNPQLTDTTVANEDQVLVPEQALFRMRYYPNPHSGDGCGISYEIEGKMPSQVTQARVTIHNVKGQLVKRIDVDIDQLRKGEGTISTQPLNAGVYILSLWLNGKRSNSEKIIIKKGRN